MIHYILALATAALLAVGATSAQSICPPADVFAPCTCNEDRKAISCRQVEGDLKEIFDRAIPFVGEDVIFEVLTIYAYRRFEIPANLTSFKFKIIGIENNYGLQYIHPDAFPASYETTYYLSIYQNGLNSNGTNRALWDFLSRFKVAETFDLRSSTFSHIPDDPFPEELPFLTSLDFTQSSGMQYFGSRIFANLPNLENVHLLECGIGRSAFGANTFEGIGTKVKLDLAYNKIEEFPEQVFRPVMDNAVHVQVGGEWCNPGGCYDSVRIRCEGARWLCENEAEYRNKLDGYICWEDSHELWAWCRLQKTNNNTVAFQ